MKRLLGALLLAIASAAEHTTVHRVRLPGPPLAFRIVIVNTAAPNGLNLNPAFTKLVAGTWVDKPAAVTPLLSSGLENHGIHIAPAADKSINSTFLYGDQTGANATGAYAVIQAFALTPAMPSFIGVQVSSNIHKATVSIVNSFFGDGPTTEVTYVITIAPPQQQATKGTLTPLHDSPYSDDYSYGTSKCAQPCSSGCPDGCTCSGFLCVRDV